MGHRSRPSSAPSALLRLSDICAYPSPGTVLEKIFLEFHLVRELPMTPDDTQRIAYRTPLLGLANSLLRHWNLEQTSEPVRPPTQPWGCRLGPAARLMVTPSLGLGRDRPRGQAATAAKLGPGPRLCLARVTSTSQKCAPGGRRPATRVPTASAFSASGRFTSSLPALCHSCRRDIIASKG